MKLSTQVLLLTCSSFFLLSLLLKLVSLVKLPNIISVLAIIFLTLTVALTTAFLINKVILKPLNEISVLLRKIASGFTNTNLDVNVPEEYQELLLTIKNVTSKLISALQNMSNLLTNEKVKQQQLADGMNKINSEKAKINALMENVDEGVIGINTDNKVFLFNKSAHRITGYSDFDVLNQDYRHFFQFYKMDGQQESDVIKVSLTSYTTNESAQSIFVTKFRKNIIVSYKIAPIINNRFEVECAVIILKTTFAEATLPSTFSPMNNSFVG